MIYCNDNGPVNVISNVHTDLPLTTVERWDSSSRNHIKIDCPHCITKYEKYICGLIPLVSVPLVPRSVFIELMNVVRNSTGPPHNINFVDVLKRATFPVFKLVILDAKIGFLISLVGL